MYRICELALESDGVFLDIGSAYGYHALRAAALCKEVVSFEPQRILWGCQRSSMRANGISNVRVLNKAVGEVDGFVRLDAIDYGGVSNLCNLSVGEGGASVPCTRIDSLDLSRVDLIKIDVQGYEERVLLGALNTLSTCRPVLAVEFESVHLVKFGSDSGKLASLIREAGYTLFLIDASYPSDVLCVPNEKIGLWMPKLCVGDAGDNEINFPLAAGIVQCVSF